jgi:CheY-like chemotaxis protein
MSNWHVLVVEDEPDGQEVIHDILEDYDISSDTVGYAETALENLQQTAYNAVIIDLALPGMDGMELLQVIKGQTAQLPCIAVTAFHNSVVKHNAIEAGFDAYLPKPLDSQRLIRELQRFLT